MHRPPWWYLIDSEFCKGDFTFAHVKSTTSSSARQVNKILQILLEKNISIVRSYKSAYSVADLQHLTTFSVVVVKLATKSACNTC